MKRIVYTAATLVLALSSALIVSCDDVTYNNTPYSQPVSGLTHTAQGRSLILSWTNPEGSTGAAILRDSVQIAAVTQGVSTYTVANADDNQLHYYTVKAIYDGGGVSEGQTLSVTLESNIKVGYYLTTATHTSLPDDDEVAAATWFKAQYVDKSTGVFLGSSDLATLNPDEVSALWIQIDRNGIGHGWKNLPFSATDIAALKAYVEKGGSLFLTKHATQLVAAIGRIEERLAPGIFGDGDGGVGTDVWCMNAVIGSGTEARYDRRTHAAFLGMETGDPNNYGHETIPLEGPGLREDHNCMWDLNAYGFPASPNVVANWQDATASTVLATWGHVTDYCCAGIVEFHPTGTYKGKVLAIGLSSYEFHQNAPAEGTQNAYQTNTERLTKNCIDYLK